MGDILIIPLKGIYFDQIKAGAKTEEYRLVTPFWTKRLAGRNYKTIVVTRGYPRRNDLSKHLVLPWRGAVVKTITHPHFGPNPVTVFAIDLSGILK